MPSSPESPPRGFDAMRRRHGERWLAIPGNVRGILWIILAGVFFTAVSALIKQIGTRIPVIEILFVRQMAMSLLMLPSILRDPAAAFRTPFLGLHALRVGLSMVAMLAGFTSIVYMPLADAIAVGFSKSLFVTVFAIWILGETVGRQRWAATLVGFLGVVVMLKPGTQGFDAYALLAVLSAAAAGMTTVVISRLARRERLVTVLTYQSLGVGIVLGPAAFWVWVQPTWTELGLMTAIGVCSAVGQSFNFNGFRAGEAAAVTSADYTRLIYATGLGMILFAEVPSVETLIGSAIIIGASAYSLHYETRRARAAPV